ncbi:MAG: hypothetical protein VYA34_14590, partial [Myxococcota bacterium]|nr:hypothetical protein [Myxococcota bacterium]
MVLALNRHSTRALNTQRGYWALNTQALNTQRHSTRALNTQSTQHAAWLLAWFLRCVKEHSTRSLVIGQLGYWHGFCDGL